METTFYHELTTLSLSGERLSDATCEKLLTASEIELLPLLDAAYQVRKTHFQNEVQLHILNNAQNGYCPEDCHYCAQASSATADIEAYSLKPDAEILAEAAHAYESGAYRYCIVMSGRGALTETGRTPRRTHPHCEGTLSDRSVSFCRTD